MQLLLRTDREGYHAGQPVQLRLEVINDKDEPLRLQFGSTRQFDFEVLWEDQLIWRWSADRLFAQVITERILPPGERWTFEATWNGRQSSGEVVKPGEYLARAYLAIRGRLDPCAERTFTIAASPAR
jgi:hypothetical protein